MLRDAGDGQSLRAHLIATAERMIAARGTAALTVREIAREAGDLPVPGQGDVAVNLRAHVRYGIALHRALLPLMDGVRSQPEVMNRFTGLVQPDGNWRDRLLAYLRAERDLGRLAPAAPVEAAATMIVGVCHELVLALLPGAADSGLTREPPEADAVVSVILDGIR